MTVRRENSYKKRAKDIPYKCRECGREHTRLCDLSLHLSRHHSMSLEDYYIKHFEPGLKPNKCPVCGKPTEFISYRLEYRKYCSSACERNSLERAQLTSQALQRQDLTDSIKRRQATNLAKYGSACSIHCPENTEKKIASIRKRYTEETGITDPFVLETINNVSQLPSVKKQVRNKYVNMNSAVRAIMIGRRRATKLEKYGDPCYSNRQKAFRYKPLNKPEAKLANFLENRGFSFIHNYDCNGKNFDFAIFDDDKLAVLVEVDGLFYHGLLSDPDGKHVHGETDCRRFGCVPEGVKFIVCDETRVEECFTEICRIFGMDYEAWIKEIVDSLPESFPYPSYSDTRMLNDWAKLCKYTGYSKFSFIGNSIIANFHHSIWDARVGSHLSPSECWKDPAKREQVVRNRAIYKSTISSQQVANGFNVSKIAPKVSVFKPYLAKYLISEFLPDSNIIFDPFSGFSGRMLGAASLGKTYIGQDISEIHVAESNRIIEYLKLDTVTVTCRDIFESAGKYDALFTCSPYGLKEHWNVPERGLSCDQWIDVCLERFKCNKYLFVVDETQKYSNNIVYDIENISHFSQNKEHVILLTRE